MRRLILSVLAGVSALAVASPASAAIIVSGTGVNTTATITSPTAGDSFQLFFNPAAGVSGDLTFTLLSAMNGDYQFNYTLNNTSTIDPSRITIFGFNTDPLLAGASVQSGIFDVIAGGPVPSGLDAVNFCLKDAGPDNNCTGGQNGVLFGGSATGTFTLDFGTTNPDSVVLSDFFLRFQGVGPNDLSFAGPPVTPPIPEPGTWAMMLLGFAGAGIAIRRSRRRSGELLQVA